MKGRREFEAKFGPLGDEGSSSESYKDHNGGGRKSSGGVKRKESKSRRDCDRTLSEESEVTVGEEDEERVRAPKKRMLQDKTRRRRNEKGISSRGPDGAETGRTTRPLGKPKDPPKYDGRGRWKDFIGQFEVIRKHNGWHDAEAAFQLFTSCHGDALAVLSANEISSDGTCYTELVKAMEQEFGPRECQEKYFMEVARREQQPGETLRDLGVEIKRLTMMAHPRTDKVERDRIAREHFKRAITDPRLREELFRTHPETLSEAIAKVEVAESFFDTENKKGRGRPTIYSREAVEVSAASSAGTMDELTAQMTAMTLQMNKIVQEVQSIKGLGIEPGKESRNTGYTMDRSTVECFNCHKFGHLAKNCRMRRAQSLPRVQNTSVVRCYR
jgi:hypothetical protein